MTTDAPEASASGSRPFFDRATIVFAVLTVIALAMYLVSIPTVAGLPAHPLFVHLPVVVLPLGSLVAIVCVWWPRARVALVGLIVVLIAALGSAILATGAGDALEEAVGRSKLVHEHAEAGDKVPILALALVVLVVGFRWLLYRNATRLARLCAVAVTVVALLTTGWVVYTGHLGSKAVWADANVSSSMPSGDGD